ncbi:MAG: PQQ-binding-like beta-propeller repeat protein, partial [Burkholderiales bacterium]|nr:PQQ-binding-like beta-propeller repeat protein [Burkholderiales bacterium]
DLAGAPVISGREVCAVSFQGKVGCFDKLTGAPIWAKEMSSDVGLGLDERYVFTSDEKGAVHAFSRDGGRSVWKNDKLSYRRLSSPVSFGRAVVVGDYQGQIHFMAREDGALLARVASDGSAIVGQPIVAGANLVLQTKSGQVLALTAP